MTLWIVCAVAFAVAFGGTRLLCNARLPFNVLDHPGPRSLHSVPTPRIGGVALVAGLLAAGGAAALLGVPMLRDGYILAGVLAVAGISLLDDVRTLPASVRLVVHGGAAGLLVAGGYGLSDVATPGGGVLPLGVLGPLFTVLFVMWMTNLYNFMDGMDGMAGGMGVIGFGTLAGVGWLGGHGAFALSAAVVGLACLGFLAHNFPPARIFLGDVGATTLGYLVAALTLAGTSAGVFAPWLPMLVFSVFVVDATVTLLRRLSRGEKVWRAHRSHYFQRLALLGWGHRRTVLTYYALMGACAATAVLLVRAAYPLADALAMLGWCLAYLLLALNIEHIERAGPQPARPGVLGWHGALVLLHDVAWVPVAVLGAYLQRVGPSQMPLAEQTGMLWMMAVTVPVYGILFWHRGLNRGVWSIVSFPDVFRVGKALLLGLLISGLLLFVVQRLEGVPRSVIVMFPLLLGLGLVGPRVLTRWARVHPAGAPRAEPLRTLVVGAAEPGERLVQRLLQGSRYLPVALLDAQHSPAGRAVHGVRILGDLRNAAEVLRSRAIQAVVLATPRATPDELMALVTLCTQARIPVHTLAAGDGSAEAALRPVTIEDLLRPEPHPLDARLVAGLLRGRRVLVTGGAGSIGAELCRQIAPREPASLVLLERNEQALAAIRSALEAGSPGLPVHAVLGDASQPHTVEDLFRRFKPELVFHAAALKHVALLEANPLQAVQVNALGTREVAQAAHRHGSERFVLISTDKALRPSTVMGASKRLAELVCASLNAHSRTRLLAVRCGNGLGSPGSVVPRFAAQIATGGPVTVTHPDIERSFMTLSELVSLVLHGAALGEGGEVFALAMGTPVKIRVLAEQMIRLAGRTPYSDIPIVFSGLRPGENLYEEPLHGSEELSPTGHPMILRAAQPAPDADWLEAELEGLRGLVERGEAGEVLTHLRRIVPEFTPPGGEQGRGPERPGEPRPPADKP